jgi:hypothetical protein
MTDQTPVDTRLQHPTPLDLICSIYDALDVAFPAGETAALAKARRAVREGIAAANAEHKRGA